MQSIIIVGYGRMGREIEAQAQSRGLQVCAVADSRTELEQLAANGVLSKEGRAGPVAVEFTGGAAAVENLQYLLQYDCPVVCGSTPWSEDTHADILELRRKRKGYLMFSSNYSIGVHIFWHVVRQTSRLLNHFSQYDLAIYEQHHNQKVDSPSGTAVHAGQLVLQEVERKTRLLYGSPHNPDGSARPIAADELQLSSQRLGHLPGTHSLLCDSEEDSLVVSHRARSRSGLARGALLAVQFLQRQVARNNAGFFTMEDLMDDFLQSE